MTNNKQLNKLNIFIIKYPFSQVIIILITYIIIRVSFIESTMCEGWDTLMITRVSGNDSSLEYQISYIKECELVKKKLEADLKYTYNQQIFYGCKFTIDKETLELQHKISNIQETILRIKKELVHTKDNIKALELELQLGDLLKDLKKCDILIKHFSKMIEQKRNEIIYS